MMRRATKVKVVLFVVITALTLLYILVDYIKLPSVLGFGRYDVAMELKAANGLYPKAVVTYRGVDVGAVTGLRPTATGVVVDLAINDDTDIPANLVAEVHSTSAVGEQFVDLVPKGSGGPSLADGDTIPLTRTKVPVSTTELLDNLRGLVHSVPLDALATTVDELGTAFADSADDMRTLLDSSLSLTDEAKANLGPTLSLIKNLGPVLDTQRASGPAISSYADDLASFTEQLNDSDADIRTMLRTGPGLARQVNGLYDDLGPTLPGVLNDVRDVGEVTGAYQPALEHVLTVYPALIASGQNLVPPSRMDDPFPLLSLDFKLSVNNPPVCVEGFEYAKHQRDPRDLRPAPLPKDSYCKVPHDDQRVVRGARNLPCPNDPDRRSPDAAGCGLIFQPTTATTGRGSAPAATPAADQQQLPLPMRDTGVLSLASLADRLGLRERK